eukprot:COSAG04_NODE_4056_length_2331_cov_2.170622_5_plen_69_part_00
MLRAAASAPRALRAAPGLALRRLPRPPPPCLSCRGASSSSGDAASTEEPELMMASLGGLRVVDLNRPK